MSARLALAAVLLVAAAPGHAQQAAPPRDPALEVRAKIAAPFTVATVGDIIAPQPLNRDEPGFKALVDALRGADVAFANMESSLVDFTDFRGGAVTGTLAPLEVGDSIKAMGIDLMSRANNHALDGGVSGMDSTDRALARLGITAAGSGENLQEARTAALRETPKGRVGLVSMFSVGDSGQFGPAYERTLATSRNGNIGGAPGVNPLRLTIYNVVSPQQLDQLQMIARGSYGDRTGAVIAATDKTPARFRFYDQWYEAGSDPGAIHYEMNAEDHRDNLAAIRSGKTAADFLIATIHAHQSPRFCTHCAFAAIKGLKEDLSHEPPDFLVQLAHEAIDNGADMFVAHGVHALAGVEIYKGRPVFYGLSNFIFQFGLQFGSGYDAFANYEKRAELENPASLESVLAVSHFEGGRLVEVRLYPVDLGDAQRPLSQLGIPRVAAPDKARRILAALQQYSRAFGTEIAIRDSIGIISLNAPQR